VEIVGIGIVMRITVREVETTRYMKKILANIGRRAMNEDLKFIESVVKEEIKSWTGYRREIVDDLGEEEFIRVISNETIEYICNCVLPETKDTILDYLYLSVEDLDEDCI
jgi:hypothetical protein